MAADHRSALPHVPGIPWWGAALLAVGLTAIGIAFDAGSGTNELGGVFVVCFVLGCVAAVLAVRQSGVFTAVIQPPLILFVAVPFAYFVFHGSTFTGIKDTLINCGYPLIERFPLMFFTSATVLLIGMVRWYLDTAAKRAMPEDADPTVETSEAASASSRRWSSGLNKRRSSRATTRAAAASAAAALRPPWRTRRRGGRVAPPGRRPTARNARRAPQQRARVPDVRGTPVRPSATRSNPRRAVRADATPRRSIRPPNRGDAPARATHANVTSVTRATAATTPAGPQKQHLRTAGAGALRPPSAPRPCGGL